VTFRRSSAIWWCAAILLAAVPAAAKDAANAIAIRAGKADSPNHTLARQFAASVAGAVNGAYTLDVQESQGSVQNVIDAVKGPRNVLFTAGPDVIAAAQRNAKPFPPDRRYRDIRALFPMPPMTLHWIVRKDGAEHLQDLAGHGFISGAKGSVGERLTTTTLHDLGVDRQVQIMDIDAAAAPAALKAGQVSGFAIAGAYPVPAILDLANALPIRLLGVPQPALAKIVGDDDSTMAEIVPKGTYPGVDEDVTTLALPVGIYTTRHMRAATAYAITKAFWTQHGALVKRNPPWQAVNYALLASLKARLHAGALRYYREAKTRLPKGVR